MSDSIGSVSVEVVPDTRGFTEKLRAQIRDPKVTVNADADTTAANAELDKTARTRTARIKVNVDKNPLEQGASALDSFTSKLGLLPALAIAGGAALVPLAGALGGIAAALAAPLAIAGGGATLFGVLAGFAVKDTEKQLKVIDAAQKKLDGLTKGTKEYAAQAKVLADAQKSLSPAQRGFSDAQSNLGASFQNFIGGKAGTALLAPLTQGMTLLSHLLPSLTPVIVAASGAFSTLLGDIGKAAASPGFDKFIRTVSGQVGHDIVGFGRAAGSIASGLGGLFVQLDKSVGSSMVDEIVRLTGAFSHWANSKRGADAIKGFIGYFHDVGPQVGDTIGAVARGVGHLVTALAPLGPPTLRVIQGIADAISGIPTPVLTALLAGGVGTVAFGKVGGFKAAGKLPAALRLGQNALSAVTGGLVPGSKYGAGVTPVYVTNPGFGSGGGGGGGGFLGKTKGILGKALPGLALGGEALTVGGALGIIGTAGIAAAATAGSVYAIRLMSKPGYVQVGGQTPQQHRAFDTQRLHDMYPNVPEIKSVGTQFDSYQSQAAGASRSLDLVGAHAESMSKKAVRSIAAMTGTTGLDSVKAHAAGASRALELIGPHAEHSGHQAQAAVARIGHGLDAAQQHAADTSRSLERIGPIAARSMNTAQTAADRLNTHLDRMAHKRTADVYLDDHGALARIAAIQYAVDRLHGKTIIVRTTGGHTAIGQATGGPVVGPGTGTSDSVPRMLSNGEYVVNANAAAQNRALLDQINYGRRSAPAASGGGGMGGRMRATIHVDGREFGAWVDMRADGVYSANQGHARDVYGPL